MALPSGYTQIEYIESTGTQWIDTGITITSSLMSSLRVVADLIITPSSSVWAVNGSGGTFPMAYFGINPSGQVAYGKGTSDGVENTVISASRYVWDYNLKDKTLKVGDIFNQSIDVSTSGTGERNFYISAYAYNGAKIHSERIYSYKFYDGTVLIRDYIPCIDSSGSVGLWDDVNSAFYGNAGSGSFTAGPEIAEPGVSKVQLQDGTVLINLTGDTVSADKLLKGCTAHDASGKKVTGGIETYSGEVAVTPGTTAKTLETAGKYIASNIEIAAAAEGMKAASGQVTGDTNQIAVSGLGFTPKYVIVVSTYNSNSTRINNLLRLAVKLPDNTTMYGYTYSFNPSSWVTTYSEITTVLSISISDGSFTFRSSNISNIRMQYNYNWYAIG